MVASGGGRRVIAVAREKRSCDDGGRTSDERSGLRSLGLGGG